MSNEAIIAILVFACIAVGGIGIGLVMLFFWDPVAAWFASFKRGRK